MEKRSETPLEIEVKFYVADPAAVRDRIRQAGARLTGKSFEHNVRFEDRDRSLVRKNALLRLRQSGGRAELTYKGEPPEKNRDFKVHRELELVVDDFDTAAGILEALGFHAEQVYEKERETYALGRTVLCLDRMPFGDFLEIEGEPGAIREAAQKLGLDWKKRILSNYLAIFERLKAECGFSFSDVTFANFSGLDVDFGRYAHRFAAGR